MVDERFIVVNDTRIKDNKGEWNHSVIFTNKIDATRHCEWLNNKDTSFNKCIEQNTEYYTCLKKIKMIVESIGEFTSEIYTLEKLIQIKNLLKEVMKQ